MSYVEVSSNYNRLARITMRPRALQRVQVASETCIPIPYPIVYSAKLHTRIRSIDVYQVELLKLSCDCTAFLVVMRKSYAVFAIYWFDLC